MSEREHTKKSIVEEDREAYVNGKLIFFTALDRWIGLPFSFFKVAKFCYNLPRTLREMKLSDVLLSIGVAVLMWYMFQGIRAWILSMQLFLAQVYLNVWLWFLPLTIVVAAWYTVQALSGYVQKPTTQTLQSFSQASTRLTLLSAVYWVSLHYADVIETFVDRMLAG